MWHTFNPIRSKSKPLKHPETSICFWEVAVTDNSDPVVVSLERELESTKEHLQTKILVIVPEDNPKKHWLLLKNCKKKTWNRLKQKPHRSVN